MNRRKRTKPNRRIKTRSSIYYFFEVIEMATNAIEFSGQIKQHLGGVEIRLRDDARSLKRAIALVDEDPEITPGNRDVILRLKDELGCSDGRKRKYVQQWRFLARWLGMEFEDATKRDIRELVNEIKARYPDELHNKRSRAKTRRDYRQALKLLYTLLEGDEDGEPPSKVRWVKTGLKKAERKSPLTSSDMLSIQERIWLIESARYLRDKAMIACLCDGLRPDELLYMRVGDVKVRDGIAWATVRGYKGERPVDFIFGTPFLLMWMEQHPFGNNPASPMWVHHRAMSEKQYVKYKRLEKIVPEVVTRAEERYSLRRERTWAYLLRHSRATDLSKKLSDAEMDEYFGWEKGSSMPQVYVHLSGKNVGNKIKRLHGIEVEDDDEEEYVLKRCPSCKRVNPPNGEKCYYCQESLDGQEFTRTDQLLEKLGKDRKLNAKIQKLMEAWSLSDPAEVITRLLEEHIGKD